MKTGLLLVNLGTPKSKKVSDVRKYLKEFLSDPKVIDIPKIVRWLLLRLFILPFRSPKSAEAYRKIWTKKGSPLLVFSRSLQEKLKKQLKEPIELAMTYGSPSISEAMKRLQKQGCNEVLVAPMFPQYATSSTGAALDKVFQFAKESWNSPILKVLPPFYNHENYIQALANKIKITLKNEKPDLYLFSFHGLPERHIHKSDSKGDFCKFGDCCEKITQDNEYCYRAHCVQTARKTAETLGLDESQYKISFQSRLGRQPWLKPYTDLLIEEFPSNGIKKLAVICPAFLTDCLETLEEIGIQAKKSFKKSGGEKLTLIPCLNDDDAWTKSFAEILSPHLILKEN